MPSAWPLALTLLLAAPPGLEGRYLLEGTARIHAPPLADGPAAASADATVSAAGAGVRVRFTWGRAGCTLTAARDARGTLAFARGQACDLHLDEPEVRGEVTARLRSGSGRADGRTLAVSASFDFSGSVSVHVGGAGVDVLGLELPTGAWGPRTPVSGTADVRLAGPRAGAR